MRSWGTRALASAVLAAALVGGACSGSGEAPGTTAEDAATEATPGPAAPAAPPEVFSGDLEAFYEVPDPLPPGEPGTLVRVQDLGEADGRRSKRVMYHSRDANDRDRAVTGIVTHPMAPAPPGGWPVVAWAHGTTGLTSVCAPSRAGDAAPAFGVEGVSVATDYIGLGPVGERHPYLSGVSEARSVIDAVRAARALEGSGAGETWVAVGHSQGGHAALFTNELGEAYAPELDLRGTVAIAPAAVLDRTFGPADQIVPNMVGLMAMYGLATEHDELDPDDYVSPEVAAQAHLIDEVCTTDFVLAMAPIPVTELYDTDPLTTEPARSILLENDPGRVRVDSPLLVVSGTADTWVVPARVEELLRRLCAVDQVVEHLVVEGGDHDSVVGLRSADITAWLDARLAGDPAQTACP